MKKFVASVILALFTVACTPSGQTSSMQSGMMCDKCPCCQAMMEGGMMKEGMQCPMMQGKDGKSCSCCQSMMDGGMKEGMQCPMMQDGKPCTCCQKMMQNNDAATTDKKAKNNTVNPTKHHTEK